MTTYALYTWAAHRLIGRGVAPRAAMGAVFGLGGLLLMPVLAATGAPLAASWSNAAVGAYMALVPMFTGYLLFGWALAHVPASTATTLSLLEPAIATILAVTVVGERLPAAGWAGLSLIAGCLVVLTATRPRFAPARLPRAIRLRREAVQRPSFSQIHSLPNGRWCLGPATPAMFSARGGARRNSVWACARRDPWQIARPISVSRRISTPPKLCEAVVLVRGCQVRVSNPRTQENGRRGRPFRVPGGTVRRW